MLISNKGIGIEVLLLKYNICRVIHFLHQNCYLLSLRKDIFLGVGRVYGLSGGGGFIRIWGNRERNNRRMRENLRIGILLCSILKWFSMLLWRDGKAALIRIYRDASPGAKHVSGLGNLYREERGSPPEIESSIPQTEAQKQKEFNYILQTNVQRAISLDGDI